MEIILMKMDLPTYYEFTMNQKIKLNCSGGVTNRFGICPTVEISIQTLLILV